MECFSFLQDARCSVSVAKLERYFINSWVTASCSSWFSATLTLKLKSSIIICCISLWTIGTSSRFSRSEKLAHCRTDSHSIGDKSIASTSSTFSADPKDALAGILDGLKETFVAKSLKVYVLASMTVACSSNRHRSIADRERVT
ncbi:hypothetical protein ANAPC5_01310 [Anaplasma phagocytophilum]|nr:hypothetical protein ANAPC5_01310 [Anaplasma phagocytophilum]